MNIRKDDTVVVIAGEDAGTRGRVLQVMPDENMVLVEGVNKVFRHLKPSRRNLQGGRLSKEMPIDLCKVMLVCPTCQKGVKVGRRYSREGRKERYCKKCQNGLGYLCKPRKAYAQKV